MKKKSGAKTVKKAKKGKLFGAWFTDTSTWEAVKVGEWADPAEGLREARARITGAGLSLEAPYGLEMRKSTPNMAQRKRAAEDRWLPDRQNFLKTGQSVDYGSGAFKRIVCRMRTGAE